MKNSEPINKLGKEMIRKSRARKMFNFYVRLLYFIVLIGYICSIGTTIFLKDHIKEYNMIAIQYTSLANDGLKTYNSVQGINSVVRDQVSVAYGIPQQPVKEEINEVTKTILKEKVFKQKEVPEEVEAQIVSENVPDVLDDCLKKLVSNKILHTVFLGISFPAFSPIFLIVLIIVILSQKRRRLLNSSPRAANYLIALPSIYVTNLILAIISISVFSHFMYAGLAIAIFAHLLFICQIIRGLRLKRKEHCIACGIDI